MKSTAPFFLALLVSATLHAAGPVRFDSQPGGSKMKIDGTSSLHAWTVECAAVGGFVELDATFLDGAAAPSAVKPRVEISIPVRQFKSGKKAMDAVMHDALKQATYPKISYKMIEMKVKGAPAGNKAEFDATGTLTVAGVTRTNTMPVTVERVDKLKLKVTGVTTVKMTDFGIKPPSPDIPGGQLIKTGDEVKITFEWTPEVEKQ